jgi:transmembrane sensor
MQKSKPPTKSPHTFVFSWRRFFMHCAIISIGVFFGLLSWYISKPQTTRFYQTNAEQYQSIAATPHIEIFLDMNSAVSVADNEPVKIELLKGNAYFETDGDALNELEVKVGDALIRDIGTRFRVSMLKDGSGNIAVEEGQVEIHVASGMHLISAGEQADFNKLHVTEHRLITEINIAPWRVGE